MSHNGSSVAHAELDVMRHSAAHVLAKAVQRLYPGSKLGIGPVIDNGFYLVLAFYGAQRFVWEFLKPYAALIGPLTLFHLLSLAILLYAAVMLVTAPVARVAHERAAA